MILRIKKYGENHIFKVYWLLMVALMIVRYVLKINVPAAAFLLVSLIPICFGSISEQMAFAVSIIPFSVAFQYKYAILMLSVSLLFKARWRLKRSGLLITILVMMVWELAHAFYEPFSYVEYLRDFAELILLGIVTSLSVEELDHKLVIRSLSLSVVAVCAIMLFMQLQQFHFNIIAVFARSARSYRFGQSNMAAGEFALNFNANNLGFLCNLASSGCLLLAARKEHKLFDMVLAVSASVFAIMTLSRAAIVCMAMVYMAYFFFTEGVAVRKVWRGLGGLAVAAAAVVLIGIFVPSVFENLTERFQRVDVWNGRGNLFKYYTQFMMSSPLYFLFGVGMQQIYVKVSPYAPVVDVPHNGLQEVWVAWGIVGLALFIAVLWKLLTVSKPYAGGRRQLYQFVPLGLTLLFVMSGQFLTSSRALLALSFSYICLCVKTAEQEKQEDTGF